MNIYNCKNYREFLVNRLDERRGSRKDLAIHLNCQSGYISQVIQNLSDFSLEQGMKACSFFLLTEDESHFFMLLLQKEKASTNELKNYFKAQMATIKKERDEIKNRIKVNPDLSVEDYHQYYSSWEFAAVHILSSIPDFQTKELLRKKLKLTHIRMNEVLDFLTSKGLVDEKDSRYIIGKRRIHLDKDSAFIISHHKNWRLHSIKTLSEKNHRNMNFSGVFSISNGDIEKIREIMLSALEKSETVIGPSLEEELIYLGIDLNVF